jgi:hypothetical protein
MSHEDKIVQDLKKELRPISLTLCISKTVEYFVVKRPAVMKIIDPNQYGTIPMRMIHNWIAGLDGTGSTIRVILFDYKKAFDFIDHKILVRNCRA